MYNSEVKFSLKKLFIAEQVNGYPLYNKNVRVPFFQFPFIIFQDVSLSVGEISILDNKIQPPLFSFNNTKFSQKKTTTTRPLYVSRITITANHENIPYQDIPFP